MDPQRCFIFEPHDVTQRRASIDTCSFAATLTTHLQTRLSLPEASVLDRAHRTTRGGYRVEVSPPLVPQIQAVTSVDLPGLGTWTCRPATSTDLPSPWPSHPQTPQHRRDSFVIVGVPLSEGDSGLLAAFASANARQLGMSPAALQARLLSTERLRRRCPSGSTVGTWQPSTSIRFVAEPTLVRRVLEAPIIFLHFRAVQVRPYTLPICQCYHCGLHGHMSRYCRGSCPFCGRQHPTRPCPLGHRVSSAPPVPPSSPTPMHGTRPVRGTH